MVENSYFLFLLIVFYHLYLMITQMFFDIKYSIAVSNYKNQHLFNKKPILLYMKAV